MNEVIEVLQGKVAKSVEKLRGDWEGDILQFVLEDGTEVKFFHEQDCCESVYIEDINGDLNDLVGTPIEVAEKRFEGDPAGDGLDGIGGWTFYTFRTIKGSVDVRWYGSSNGYYGIGVSCRVNGEYQ